MYLSNKNVIKLALFHIIYTSYQVIIITQLQPIMRKTISKQSSVFILIKSDVLQICTNKLLKQNFKTKFYRLPFFSCIKMTIVIHSRRKDKMLVTRTIIVINKTLKVWCWYLDENLKQVTNIQSTLNNQKVHQTIRPFSR